MLQPRILFAEDDPTIRRMVATILEEHGFATFLIEDGPRCLEAWEREPYDLVLLDVMLPGIDGLQVCRSIRQNSSVPIIMLTALKEEGDTIRGLEAGADDYIAKPFRPGEFIARIRAALKGAARQSESSPDVLISGDLTLDPRKQQVFRAGRLIHLSPTEYRLLRYLIHNHERTIPKEELLQEVWGYSNVSGDLNLVETAVRRLRRQIEDNPRKPRYLQTVWGVGYRFGDNQIDQK